ncbi:hypothetical protein [Saccharothrix algeriensis]|uniref:Integral membrane protein n=3 Tax=Saccharothrix algeriensis TaxID=173560 RepID=A0ABS2S216_9PSEU|nr:hypothetical protein [Saccharothrix algeriensis]MBM7810282.1 hypothetical protein [Saccharothrix algeriensis]
MTGRVLGVELRRSSAPAAGLLVGLLGALALYAPALTDQTSLWDTQWTSLAVFQRITLVVLWPLVLGAGAWQAWRDHRARVVELLATTPRPVRQRVAPTACALAIALVAAYAAVSAAGAVRVAGATSYAHLDWVAVTAVGALSLVAAAWLGMGIGRLRPSVHTPPVLVLVGFVLLLTPVQLAKEGSVGAVALLSPAFGTTAGEFARVAGAVNLGQALWFAALAAGGFVLAAAARARSAAPAAAPVAAGLALALPLLAAAPATGFEDDARASAEVCTTDGGPRVCVAAAHAAALPALTGPAREALAVLGALPDAPTSFHEITGDLDRWRTRRQPADEVWFHSDNLEPGGAWSGTGSELVARVLAGAGTRPCHDGDRDVRAVVGAWLAGSLPESGAAIGERRLVWERLRALPAEEQARSVVAWRTAALGCEGGPGALPAAGGAR